MTKKGKAFVPAADVDPDAEPKKLSNHAQRSVAEKKKGTFDCCVSISASVTDIRIFIDAKIDPLLEAQFAAGRLYASISSRPGQSGRADGYVLEGKELEVSPFCALYISPC